MAKTIAQEVAEAKKAAADRAKATAAATAKAVAKKATTRTTTAKPFTQPMTISSQTQVTQPPKSTVFTQPMTIAGQSSTQTTSAAASTVFTTPMTVSGQTPITPPPSAVPEVIDPTEAAKDKILTDTLTSYGMQGISATVALIRSQNPKISSEDLVFLLKNDLRYNSEYLKRFPGNAKLKTQGLPTIDDATYLAAEKEYEKTFKAYGATSLANRDYYGTLIANKMDLGDVTDRLNLAYTRLKATPEVKKAFGQFYSAITDGEILAAMLDPTTQVPLLEKKVVAAEIGGAALAQNLQTSLVSATDLQAYGVTRAGAQVGYAEIAPKLKRGKFLTQVAPETGVDYTQQLAEDIQFKKSAAAKEQEERVISAELSKWGGSPGTMGSKAFASQQRGAGLI